MNFNKINKKLNLICAVTLSVGLLFTGCTLGTSKTASGEETASVNYSNVDGSTIDVTDQFTKRDLDASYDESEAIKVTLSDGASVSDSDSVKIDGDTITISEEGVYVFSGTLTNGQIVVDNEEDDAKIQIVLDNVSIINSSSACIYVKSADKVFVTTKEGSTNSLIVTGEYVAIDENNIDAVIFSKDDLVLNGSGTLNIEATYGHGVVSKDDLKVTGGTVNINAAEHGLSGKDSVRITSATINIEANEDGIHSSNEDDENETAGYIYVADGNLTIKAGDDGMHADLETRIDGGSVTVTESYEGLEGQIVTICGGDINITASDDGINAGGGADASGENSGFGGGKDMFSASNTNCKIYIYGGNINVNSRGDGIDSNGDLYVYGGEIYVDGPENDGNGALDKGEQSQAYIYGGTIIATGMSGMAESFCDQSSQVSILLNLEETVSGEVSIKDANGNVIASYTPSKSYNSVVVSSSELKEGETYTISAGGTDTEITVDGISVTEGEGGSAGFGGGRGGQMPNGEAPNGEAPSGEAPSGVKDGERPELPEGVEEGDLPERPSDGQRPQGNPPSGDTPQKPSN